MIIKEPEASLVDRSQQETSGFQFVDQVMFRYSRHRETPDSTTSPPKLAQHAKYHWLSNSTLSDNEKEKANSLLEGGGYDLFYQL